VYDHKALPIDQLIGVIKHDVQKWNIAWHSYGVLSEGE
jgi:hypothetical protein